MTFLRKSSPWIQSCRMFSVILLIAFGLSSPSYGQDTKDPASLRTVDLIPAFSIGKSWYLSRIARDIEYVRLETPPGDTIRSVGQVDVGSRFITVADTRNREAFLFTRDGRFVRRLGRTGEGAGTFGAINNLTLTTNERLAALYDSGRAKVILFSTDEEGFREIPIHDGPSLVIAGPGNTLLASYTYPAASHTNFNQFAWIDTESGNRRFFGIVPETVRTWENIGVPVCRLGNEWYVNQLYDNIIYVIGPSGSLHPAWRFGLGDRGIPPDRYRKAESFASAAGSLYRNGTWTAFGDFLLINLLRGNQVRHVLCNTADSSAFSLIDFGPARNQVIDNNIDGGPSFWFDLTTDAGEPAQILPAARILQMRKDGDFEKFKPENPAARQRFLKLLGQIRESDNPMIQILKKD